MVAKLIIEHGTPAQKNRYLLSTYK
ncbi:hypothetical protein [Streptomyces sp. NPDC007100]